MQNELNVRKILGRTYLNENQLGEALNIFVKILRDYPEDLETLLILGGFYLAGGDGKTAKKLYLRAQQLDPQNKTIERQVTMAEELEHEKPETSIPTDMDSVSLLLQRLTGKSSPIEEKDILRAADLLAQIINSNNPADLVSAHLDEIDDLLLALIEVNIRQARADGRRDIAEALHNLQVNIDIQMTDQDSHVPAYAIPGNPERQQFTGRLLMLLPDPEKKSNRMALVRSALQATGCQITENSSYAADQDPRPDLVITSNPHTHPRLVESLSVLSGMEVPIILDLDTDFTDQPVDHKEYGITGLGTQVRSNAYALAVSSADLITVPSQVQAYAFGDLPQAAIVIPDGWSRQNKFWEKDSSPHDMINIGWVGTSGELEDLILIRRYIIRILREFPNTRIVIVGNPQAYRLFDGLSENRRMYIPLVGHEEFPYVLSQLDILLVPLRNLPYNQSLPDTILMQAGVRGIPWLATPIPSFRDWMAGGILTETVGDDWHLNLRHLVLDQDLRNSLGRNGREAARAREMQSIGKLWLDIISRMLNKEISPSQNMRKP